jgi:hypothetical protein
MELVAATPVGTLKVVASASARALRPSVADQEIGGDEIGCGRWRQSISL